MNEIELLRRIARKAPAAGRGLLLGIGDDCAIFRSKGAKEDLLFTTDMMLEDVHFRRDTHPAESVGWKALARGLSDIAAMGGEPRFCLLSLAVPEWADQRWIDAFYRGFLRLARKTSRRRWPEATWRGRNVWRATSWSAARRRPEKRCGATARAPGDGIYVSGPLGGAALGLETRRGAAWKKHSRPEPRLEFGLRLRGRASAAIDLSDGLSLDLHRLCLRLGLRGRTRRADSGVSRRDDRAGAPRRRGLRVAVHRAQGHRGRHSHRQYPQRPARPGGVRGKTARAPRLRPLHARKL